jgi:hypothetical protein
MADEWLFPMCSKMRVCNASFILGPRMSEDPGDPPPPSIFLLYNTMEHSSPTVSKKIADK